MIVGRTSAYQNRSQGASLHKDLKKELPDKMKLEFGFQLANMEPAGIRDLAQAA